MTDKLTEKRNEFFYIKFRELFDDWKRRQKENGERHSQEEFARRIIEAEEKRGIFRGTCDYRFVSKWYTGKTFPETYLEEIADVLGVSVDVFSPQLYIDRLLFDEDLSEQHVREVENYAKENGVDFDFLHYLTKNYDVPEVTDWSNIIFHDLETPRVFVGSDFQYEKNGETYIFGKETVDLMKRIQTNVEECIRTTLLEESLKHDEDMIRNLMNMTEIRGNDEERQKTFNYIVMYALAHCERMTFREVKERLESHYNMRLKLEKGV